MSSRGSTVAIPSVRVSVFRPTTGDGHTVPGSGTTRVAIPSVRVSVFRLIAVFSPDPLRALEEVAIPSVRVSVFRLECCKRQGSQEP